MQGDPSAGPTAVRLDLTCGELRPAAAARPAVDAFLGRAAPTPLVQEALQMGEDMDYDQYKTLIERHAITHAFNQVDSGIPIEFAGIQTRLWDLQNPDTVHGTVFKRYAKRNQVTITSANAPTMAGVALGQLIGSAGQVVSTVPADGVQLVLLPYGTDATGMATTCTGANQTGKAPA